MAGSDKRAAEMQPATVVMARELAAAVFGALVGVDVFDDEQVAVILRGLSKRLRETGEALADRPDCADSATLQAFAAAFDALGQDHAKAFRKKQESW